MADEQNPTNEQKPEGEEKRITLDPSKFTISEDGKVILTAPEFADALRAAADDDDANGHGIGVAVIF
ncbi:hypothetical protein KSD_78120 [Ktedonobacter sp. SOSP1-85]|uniref:hypothetical protein n=1 Tax=Ktedonobacter sp. SOSP1-85 TaxID=2778367 RepID=UPI00191519BE|nr:hypothetical protein [Ktedonobacter sp. SOSP1-85]GHO80041.1 hypothetical protein KSD_78120 [Ktedonobacter sp. SOSP1-85]